LKSLKSGAEPFSHFFASITTFQTGSKGNDNTRKRWKTGPTRNLYRRGFEKQDVINLYRFIDWIMVLPAELEKEVRDLQKSKRRRDA